MLRLLEQVVGVALILAVMADVFLTVLYARVGRRGLARFGTGVISERVAVGVWRAFRWAGTRGGRINDDLLSFAAPVIVVLFLAVWVAMLTAGSAMVLQPALGSDIRATSGHTPTDFFTAFFIAGGNISTMGAGPYVPRTWLFRAVYVINALTGLSILTLTLTYLMQIYTTLQRRNTLAFKLDVMAGSTGDAAELVAGLGVGGHFDAGYTQLAELGAEIVSQKEAYQFYPVLFYFRYRQACYATSRMALMLLDAVSLMQGALGSDAADWIKRTAAVKQLWLATIGLITTLDGVFLPGNESQHSRATPDEATLDRWRRRYASAVRRFEEAGIETTADEEAGFREYVDLRIRWQRYIEVLADYMAHDLAEIDPEGCNPPVFVGVPAPT
jgi:hypothetical protein